MTEKVIDKFRAEHRFLSNFWPAKVSFDGMQFDCVEKAYVAAKFLKGTMVDVEVTNSSDDWLKELRDPDEQGRLSKWITVSLRELAQKAGGPGQVKRLGRKYSAYLRDDWDDVKLHVMRGLIAEKFSANNPELVAELLKTGEADLIEGNSWGDTYWGVVTGGRKKALIGQGQNNLGKLLMARRRQLQDENNPKG
jgi:ribA/ribD-fused uncharacterized protein